MAASCILVVVGRCQLPDLALRQNPPESIAASVPERLWLPQHPDPVQDTSCGLQVRSLGASADLKRRWPCPWALVGSWGSTLAPDRGAHWLAGLCAWLPASKEEAGRCCCAWVFSSPGLDMSVHLVASGTDSGLNQIDSGHVVKHKKKSHDFAQLSVKVRCPCHNPMGTRSMIKIVC